MHVDVHLFLPFAHLLRYEATTISRPRNLGGNRCLLSACITQLYDHVCLFEHILSEYRAVQSRHRLQLGLIH